MLQKNSLLFPSLYDLSNTNMLSTIARRPLRTVKTNLPACANIFGTRHVNLQPDNAAWQIAVLKQNAKEEIDRLLKRFETQRIQIQTECKQDAQEEIDRLLKISETEKDRLLKISETEKDWLLKMLEMEKDRVFKMWETGAIKAEGYITTIAYLKASSSRMLEENLRLKGNFNLRGALEYIGHAALCLDKIKTKGGTNDRLMALSNTEDFTKILQRVAEERNLIQKEIKAQVPHLYHGVSKIAHGNDSHWRMIIRTHDLTVNERAAIVCFLKLQNEWPVPSLTWEEEEEEESTNLPL
ncbi:hypothetical protein BDZ91DRAFT_748359 [Kalaharituber pfeilii]|nr:hypothetical protein BDZ91DRAFT_748359 [Kalaharituber pfeilii]